MHRGGGLKAAPKSAPVAISRTHIKRVLTVLIVTATSVQYAYRKTKIVIRFVLVAVGNYKRFYGSTRDLERCFETRHYASAGETLFRSAGSHCAFSRARRPSKEAREATHDRSGFRRRSTD